MKYTRRNALKMGAAASASLILPSAISCQNQEDKKLGIALVGLGNYNVRFAMKESALSRFGVKKQSETKSPHKKLFELRSNQTQL